MLLLISLFYSYFIALTHQNCLADVFLPNLVQDSIEILITGSQMIERFEYPLIFFDEDPKFGFSINRIEWNQIHELRYSLSHSFSKNSLIISYQEPQFNSQSFVRRIGLTVWVSSRKDLIFGTAFLRNIQALNHSTEQVFLEPMRTNPKIQNIKVFISLFNMNIVTEMDYLHIESSGIVKQNNNQNRQQFPLKLIANVSCGHHTTVNELSLSFVILTPSLLDKHSHHYSSLSTQIKFNPQEATASYNAFINDAIKIYPLQYALVGLTGIRLTGTSKISLQFKLISENLDFLNIVSSNSIDALIFNYLIMGNNMMMACIECPDAYVSEIQGSPPQCINQNECEKIPIQKEQEMMFACKDCANELNMHLIGKESEKYCECKQGYTLGASNSCQKIYIANSIASSQCSDPLAIRNPQTNRCECKKGYSKDFFGFCSVQCSIENSYWDYNSKQCLCFTGYNKIGNNCVQQQTGCRQNQNFINGQCICDSNSVLSQDNQTCIMCQKGEYKDQLTRICKKCSIRCKQCLSDDLCLSCNEGYFEKDLKCVSICGDGFRAQGQECDDGNKIKGDGCSPQCMTEDGFICQQQISQSDICVKVVEDNSSSLNALQGSQSSFGGSGIVCRFSLLKQPIYLNGGIVVEVSIVPMDKLLQSQVNNLFKVNVDKQMGKPSTIYITQYEQNQSYFRIYLHYDNQLPVIDFQVTINVWLKQCQQGKWLRFNSFVLDYEISDALSVSRNDQLL